MPAQVKSPRTTRRKFLIGGAAATGLLIGYAVWPRNRPLNLVARAGEQIINGWLKIQTKVNERPIYSFTLVFLLLQYKHSMIEQLLQLLIGVIDAQLFEGIHLKRNNTDCDPNTSTFARINTFFTRGLFVRLFVWCSTAHQHTQAISAKNR